MFAPAAPPPMTENNIRALTEFYESDFDGEKFEMSDGWMKIPSDISFDVSGVGKVPNHWFNAIHVDTWKCHLKDGKESVVIYFTFSGTLRLKGISVIEGNNHLKICGTFIPGLSLDFLPSHIVRFVCLAFPSCVHFVLF